MNFGLSDFTYALSPHSSYGNTTLRPIAATEGQEIQGLKTALRESAKDGGAVIRFESPVPVARGISKQEILFEKEGTSAKGRILFLDPRDVKIEQRHLPEAVNFDIDPDIPPGDPKFKWMPGLSLQGFVAREEIPPLAATNSLQSNFKVKNGFLIIDGKLVAKPKEARGIWQRGEMLLNGTFSVFALDEGRLGIQQVEIKDDQLVTEGIREAISGPPLLLDGKDVSGQVRMGRRIEEGKEGPGAANDEVAPWDPRTTRASWSALGVNREGKIVLASLIGDSLLTDLAVVLQKLDIRDAILMGGSGDVQQYLRGDETLTAAPQQASKTKEDFPRKLGAALVVYAKDGGFQRWTPEYAKAYVQDWEKLTLPEKKHVLKELNDPESFHIGVNDYFERIATISASPYRPEPSGGYAFPQPTPISDDSVAKGRREIKRLGVVIVAGGAGSRFYEDAKVPPDAENQELAKIAQRFRDFQGVTIDQVDSLADRYEKMTIPLTKIKRKSSLQLILETLAAVDPTMPVAIGVGPDTQGHIETLLRENNNFGLKNIRLGEDDPNFAVDLNKRILLTPKKELFKSTEGGAGALRALRKKPEEGGDPGFEWFRKHGRTQLLIFNADNPGLPLNILYGIVGLASQKKSDIVGVAYRYPKDLRYNKIGALELDEFGLPKPARALGAFVTERSDTETKTVVIEAKERSEALRKAIRAWESDPNHFIFANAGAYLLSLEVAQEIVEKVKFPWHASPPRTIDTGKDKITGETISVEGYRFEHFNPDLFELLHLLRLGKERVALLEDEGKDLLSMKNISEWAAAQDKLTAKDSGSQYHPPTADFDAALRRRWDELLLRSAYLREREEKAPIHYDLDNPIVVDGKLRERPKRMEGPYEIKLIPERIVAKKMRTTTPTARVRTVQPFDPAAFNFNHVRELEILDLLLLRGRPYRVLTNINPNFNPHVVIHVPEGKPQYFEPQDQVHIEAIVELQRLSDLRIVFNGINAGASKNHFHFQGFFHPLPVERAEVGEVIRIGDVSVGVLKNWAAQNIVLQSDKLESLAGAAMQLVNLLMEENIPHDLLFLKDKIIVFLRSEDLSALEGIMEDVDFAALELSGVITTLSERAFKTLTFWGIEEALRRTTLSADRKTQILSRFILRLGGERHASDGAIRFILDEPESLYYQFLERTLSPPPILTQIVKGLDPKLSSRDLRGVRITKLHALADTGDDRTAGLWYMWHMILHLKGGRKVDTVVKMLGPWLSSSEREQVIEETYSTYERLNRVSTGIIPKLLYRTRVSAKEVDPKNDVLLHVVEYAPLGYQPFDEEGVSKKVIFFDELKLFEKAVLFWKHSDSVVRNRYIPNALYEEAGKVHFFRKPDGQIDARILEMRWHKTVPSERALLEELAKDARDVNHLFHGVLSALGKEEGLQFLEKAERQKGGSPELADALRNYLRNARRYADYLSVPEFHLVLTAYQEIGAAIRAVDARRVPLGAKRKRSLREAVLEEVEAIRAVITLAEKLKLDTETWLPNDGLRARSEGKSFGAIKEEILTLLFGRGGTVDGRDRGFVGKEYIPGEFTFATRHRFPSFEKDVLRILAYHDWVAEEVAKRVPEKRAEQRAFVRLYRSVRAITDARGNRIIDSLSPEESQKLVYDLARIYFGTGPEDSSVNPFRKENRDINTFTLTLTREILDSVASLDAEGAILDLLSYKVAANLLDLTHQKYAEAYWTKGPEFFRNLLKEASRTPLLIGDAEEFLAELYQRPRPVSWDLDNNGELVFDLLLVQNILNHWEKLPDKKKGKITIIPKSLPVSNDATVADVEEVLSDPLFEELRRYRREGRFEVLTTGPRIQGTDYTRLSKESADLYETLLREDGLLVKNGAAQVFTAPWGGRTPDTFYIYKAKGLVAKRFVGPFDRHRYGNDPHLVQFIPGKLLSQGVTVIEGRYPSLTQTQQEFHRAVTEDLPLIERHLGDRALSILLNQKEESGKGFSETAHDLANLYRGPVAAVLLAGGKGKGLESTEELPKPIVEVGGKPAALHFLDVARSMEIPTVVVVGFGAPAVRKALGEKRNVYVMQKELSGTAAAVLRTRELLERYNGQLLVAMGDVVGYTEWMIEDLQRAHAPPPKEGKKDVAATLSTKILENPRGKGRIVRDADGNIVGIVEQKDIDQLIKEDGFLEIGGMVLTGKELDGIQEVNTGFYLFNNRLLFEVLPQITPSPVTGEIYLTDAIKLLAQKGYEIRKVTLLKPKQVSGITTPRDVADREAQIQKERLEGPASIGILYQEFLRATGRRGIYRGLFDPTQGPVTAILGGGTGPAALTRGLALYTENMYHVITVFDSGGSTGIIREAFDIPAMGDLRNRLTTLLPEDKRGEILREIFTKRLDPTEENQTQGLSEEEINARLRKKLLNLVTTLDPQSVLQLEIKQFLQESIAYFVRQFPGFPYAHANVGNLIFVSEYFQHGQSITEAVKVISQNLGLKENALLPVTQANLDLRATFEDGTIVNTQIGIVNKELEVGSTVRDLSFVKRGTAEQAPSPLAAPLARHAVQAADIITVGPGSTYSSYLPVLLSRGIVKNLRESLSPKILFVNIGAYPGNIVREKWLEAGQPLPKSVPASHTLGNILRHMQKVDPRPSRNPRDYFDYIVVNSHRPDPRYVPLDVEHLKAMGFEVLMAPLEDPRNPGHHDPERIAKVIMQIYDMETHGYGIDDGQLIKTRNAHRTYSRDGGDRRLLGGVRERLHDLFRNTRELRRRVELWRQLGRQKVRIRGGLLSLLTERVYFGPEVDISQFRNGIVEWGTQVTGASRIGPRSHLSGRISNSVIGERVVIIRGREIVDSTVGNGSRFRGASVTKYDIGEGVRIYDATLSMEGETTFGNGIEFPVGSEAGGREIAIYAEMMLDEAKRVLTQRKDIEFLRTYQSLVESYAKKVKSQRGFVGDHVRIENSPKIVNAWIGSYANVDTVGEIANATILSGQGEKTVVAGRETIVRDAILQWGVTVFDDAKVENAALLEYAEVGKGAHVYNSILGPNTLIHRGEVAASFLGPFVVSHHLGTILIGILWPEGRGNVGGGHVGSNQPARLADQEAHHGEGLYIGINTSFRYPLSLAPFGIVSLGLKISPQRVEYPFFFIVAPKKRPLGISEDLHEIIPAGGLMVTPYTYTRMEAKHKTRNRAQRTSFDFRVFKPQILRQMMSARDELKRGKQKEVYTQEDYPGLGANFMTESVRRKAVDTYTLFIRWALLAALKEKLEGVVKETKSRFWGDLVTRLMAEGEPEWEETKALLQAEWGRPLATWTPEEMTTQLGEAISFQKHYYRVAEESKRRDFDRGVRIQDDYGEIHGDVDDDQIIQDLGQRTESFIREAEQLEARIQQFLHIAPLIKDRIHEHRRDLLGIDQATFGETPEGAWTWGRFLENRRYEKTLLRGKWYYSRIATLGKRTLGYLIAFKGNQDYPFSEGSVHLHRLAVDPAFQRSGIGQRLIREVALLAGKEGILTLTLETKSTNRGAKRLYEDLGFERIGERYDPQKNLTFYQYKAQVHRVLARTATGTVASKEGGLRQQSPLVDILDLLPGAQPSLQEIPTLLEVGVGNGV